MKTIDQQRNKRVDKAQMRILFHTPFFAAGVARLPVVWDDTVESNGQPTACTDGSLIRWNRAHFDSLDDPTIVTVLAHEVCHCMLGHLWRFPAGGDCATWNEATDHAVNTMLAEFGAIVKAGGMADPFPLPEGCLADPAFKGMAEEAIYAQLSRSRPPGGGGKPGKTGQGVSGASKPGQSAPQGQKPFSGQPASGAGPSGKPIGQFSKPAKPTTAQKQDKSDWEGTLVQACAAMKGRGKLPGSLERYVQELVSPKVPWVELLRNFLREQCNDDWTWLKPNVYYEGEFILPSLDSDRMGAVVFAVDTSGSIDRELLTKFKSEMQGCLDDLKPSRVLEICCDTRITREAEYRQGDTVGPEAPGGGGTSFKPVFERLAQLERAPKCVVYLTDLDGAFPKEEPNYAVLWITYSAHGQKAPFGETVEVE